MRFRILKELDWDGKHYKPGDVLEIREDHPRLGAMVRARHMMYDATVPDGKREAAKSR